LAGLTGHLDEFWPDINNSGWIGGSAEGWERGPYWLDGAVPLAFLLNDEQLLNKVRHWVDYILDHQLADGWLGPIRDTAHGDRYRPYDPWPVFVALKALTQYQEATGDERVIAAVQRLFRKLSELLEETPLFDWGMYRWADLAGSIYWLYERRSDPSLMELVDKVHAQGFDWGKHFESFPYREKVSGDDRNLASHVVNNAMGIKQPGVWYRRSKDPADAQATYRMLEVLDQYHGQVTGVFTGDEHLAGKNPSQGTELCAVVEYLYSLEVLLSILGDANLGDRLEKVAFNSLPASFRPDMWAHQYDQQVNQVVCRVAEDRIYTSNSADANIFGLEPNYGCCTANMHQGWPKFAEHLWMRTQGDGLAAVAYAPNVVDTEIQGIAVQIETRTNYPFEDSLLFFVTVEGPVRFPLELRIPAWAEGAEITLNGAPLGSVEPGTFYRLEREWSETTPVTLRLPMPVRTELRYHNSISILRGPLVFSFAVGDEWRQIGGELPHADWEVYPTTPWNYALKLDPERPEQYLTVETRPVGQRPFSPAGAPVSLHLEGKRVEGWKMDQNAAGPLPPSPVSSDQALETLRLIPYGCTHLRVTEFPMLNIEEDCA